MTSVLLKATGTNHATFTPSTQLAGLPNGAGTIASLFQPVSTGSGWELCGLGNSGQTDWFHTLIVAGAGGVQPFDDDGQVGATAGSNPTWNNAHLYILAVTWTGNPAVERFHYFDLTAGGSWTHVAGGTAGALRASSGAIWNIGYTGDGGTDVVTFGVEAAWAGVALADLQVEALSTNAKTSDWYNNAAGHPDHLVECISTTPTDIGAHPSTFASIGGLTLTGTITAWTFDGQGSPAAPSAPPYTPHRMPLGV